MFELNNMNIAETRCGAIAIPFRLPPVNSVKHRQVIAG